MSSFQDFGVFLHNNPEAKAQRSYAHVLELRRMRVTPFGFCLRVIMKEKPQHLEKTTFTVLSVIVNQSMLHIMDQRTGSITDCVLGTNKPRNPQTIQICRSC